jgi:putative flippase GtrA
MLKFTRFCGALPRRRYAKAGLVRLREKTNLSSRRIPANGEKVSRINSRETSWEANFSMSLKTEVASSPIEVGTPRFPLARAVCGRGIKGEGQPEAGVKWPFSERLIQFIKFCFVGGSGVVVDMSILALLADPEFLGWNIILSKIIAAETAMTNNFIWNELWTFRSTGFLESRSVLRRFLVFNAICAAGIGLAILLLYIFHSGFGLNLYVANLIAIVLVTLWNFGMNARFNWYVKIKEGRA